MNNHELHLAAFFVGVGFFASIGAGLGWLFLALFGPAPDIGNPLLFGAWVGAGLSSMDVAIRDLLEAYY